MDREVWRTTRQSTRTEFSGHLTVQLFMIFLERNLMGEKMDEEDSPILATAAGTFQPSTATEVEITELGNALSEVLQLPIVSCLPKTICVPIGACTERSCPPPNFFIRRCLRLRFGISWFPSPRSWLLSAFWPRYLSLLHIRTTRTSSGRCRQCGRRH